VVKSAIPDPLERRHQVERDLPADQALAIAEAYLAEARFEEAVAFLGKAGADERLAALADEAVASGDVFLLSEVSRVRGREPEPDTWKRLAESARRAGKDAYAESAERHAHRSDE
jgi:hypothetical protein